MREKKTHVWDMKQVSVEVEHIHQANNVQNEGHDLPDVERREKQEDQKRKP